MSDTTGAERTKGRLIYAALVATGGVFVLSLVLPVSDATAQFVATLSFGLMSGLWLSHLVHSV
jgi:hypothetical protein